MKQLFFVLAIILFCSIAYSQPAAWIWAVRAGGNSSDFGNSIARDSIGNLYVTGSFTDTTSFGTITLISNGESDIFVAKLDTNGNWLWAVRAGGTFADAGFGITSDSAGNVCLTGNFKGTAEFGTLSLTSNGASWEDIFVAKLDSSGNWLWAVRSGGASLDNGYSVSSDSADNYYVAGSFYLTADFGTTNLTTSGSGDLFVAKLDTNGIWQWAVKGGGGSLDIAYDIATDPGGSSYIIGQFFYGSSFGTISLLSAGESDILVAKVDTNGNWLWAQRAGSYDPENGQAITLDGSGSCYITGTFRETADFGTTNLTCSGGNDIFIAKLDTNGNWLWADQAGGTGIDYGYGICLDSRGIVIVAGNFYNTASFGSLTLTSTGITDIFVCGLNVNGGWQWVKSVSGSATEKGNDLVSDSSGSCYLAGTFFSNPSWWDAINISSAGSGDIFASKLSVPALPPNAFPFLEDWSSGSIYTNFWYAESPGWQISTTLGNPSPTVVFQPESGAVGYDYSLISNRFDGIGLTSVKLKFDIDFSYIDWMGANVLYAEVWNGTVWTTVGTYTYYSVTEPTTIILDISSLAVGNNFKIRFRANGGTADMMDYWILDNIRLEEIPITVSSPQNVSFTRVGENLVISWDAVPEADWYAMYVAFEADGLFTYGGWFDASITMLDAPITPDMEDFMFFYLTAGAGAPPSRNLSEQTSLNRNILSIRR